MFDMGVLLNRLDQMEAKVEQHEAIVSLVDQHERKINSQQLEIDQLKKKLLEEQNKKLIQASDDVTSRDLLSRSCFEIKATNPSALSGVYSIDPNGQIGADDQPIQVHCDMTTRNIVYLIIFKHLM